MAEGTGIEEVIEMIETIVGMIIDEIDLEIENIEEIDLEIGTIAQMIEMAVVMTIEEKNALPGMKEMIAEILETVIEIGVNFSIRKKMIYKTQFRYFLQLKFQYHSLTFIQMLSCYQSYS